MPETDSPKQEGKAELRALRSANRERIERVSKRVREQKKILKAIRAQLTQAPGTVPEIAAATGMSPDRVLWYVAAMKKYGELTEMEKAGDYYRYALATDAPGAGA
jgi:predicted transcriptional regulator